MSPIPGACHFRSMWVAQTAVFFYRYQLDSIPNCHCERFLRTLFRMFRFLRVIANFSLVTWRSKPAVRMQARQEASESSSVLENFNSHPEREKKRITQICYLVIATYPLKPTSPPGTAPSPAGNNSSADSVCPSLPLRTSIAAFFQALAAPRFSRATDP